MFGDISPQHEHRNTRRMDNQEFTVNLPDDMVCHAFNKFLRLKLTIYEA